MPIITTSLLLEIADRIAAQYALLLTLQNSISIPATQASALVDPPGINNVILYTARYAGAPGNLINIEYVNPGLPNKPEVVTVTGNTIKVQLQTSPTSMVVSTGVSILASINASAPASALVIVAASGLLSGFAAAVGPVFLAGGLHGLFETLILQTEDVDLAAPMTQTAQDLDENVTADLIISDLAVWGSFLSSLATHFARVEYSGGINGFLLDNDIRVHQYFDQVYFDSLNFHLASYNVFKADSQVMANMILEDDPAFAQALIQPLGAKAAVTITQIVNTALLYTAVTPGVPGNAVNVTYINPGLPSQALSVEVQGKDIYVHLATDGSSVLTSTAGAVLAAVNAHAAASALVVVTAPGLTTGILTAQAKTYLSNRDTAIRYTSVRSGSEGNEVSVQYINPGAALQPLTVTLVGEATIQVSLATDAGSLIISTAAQVKVAVDAVVSVAALVSTAIEGGTGAGVVSAIGPIFLQGGVEPILSDLVPLGSGQGQTGDENYAAQKIKVTVTPAVNRAFLDLIPTNGKAFCVVTPAQGPNNKVRFTSLIAKTNEMQKVMLTGGPTGGTFTLSFNLVPSAAIPFGAAAAVVQTALEGIAGIGAGQVSVTGVAGGPWFVEFIGTLAQANQSQLVGDGTLLTGGISPAVSVSTIHDGGISQTGIQIIYKFLQVPLNPLTISVLGNAITITMATDATTTITTTANAIIAAVNADPFASQLVLASNEGLGTGVIAGTPPPPPEFLSLTGITVHYEAKVIGVVGNLISVRYVDPLAVSQPLVVSVLLNAITVSLATDGGGNIISTAAQIVTAINASVPAFALVTASNVGTISGVVTATSATLLDGGAGPNLVRNTTLQLSLHKQDLTIVSRDFSFTAGATPGTIVNSGAVAASLSVSAGSGNCTLIYTAVVPGAAGNSITIEYIDPNASNSPLSVSVTGVSNIKVRCATDYNGRIVSTADEIKNLINSTPSTNVLVVAANSGFGHGYVAVFTTTNLTNGFDPERYFDIVSAEITTGGELNDSFTVTSLVERQPTL